MYFYYMGTCGLPDILHSGKIAEGLIFGILCKQQVLKTAFDLVFICQ